MLSIVFSSPSSVLSRTMGPRSSFEPSTASPLLPSPKVVDALRDARGVLREARRVREAVLRRALLAPHGHELLGGRLLAEAARRLRGRGSLLQERGDGLGRLLIGVALRGAALLGDGLADFLVTRLPVGALAVATAVERLAAGAGRRLAVLEGLAAGGTGLGEGHAGRVGEIDPRSNTRLQALC